MRTLPLWVWVTSGCMPDPVVPAAADCDALPTGPFVLEPFPASANEDIGMDSEGFLVGADNSGSLWRTDATGERTLVLPASGIDAGLRAMWWDDTLASVQYGTNALFRIDPRVGSRELLLGGLWTPSGIEIGPDHGVWFTELNGDRVQRFDTRTGESTVIAEGIRRPNGLTLNRAYDRLYVAATDDDQIVAIDIDPTTRLPLGPPEVFVDGAGDGIDGLSVDACGNVYAAWWSRRRIERWDAQGGRHEVLIDDPGSSAPLGNFAWGAEAFGWSPTTIYAVVQGPGTVVAIELGVREKPRPGPQ